MEGAVAHVGGYFVDAVQLMLTAVCVLLVIRAWLNWSEEGLKPVPKGSSGWPILGETISVLRSGGSYPFEQWIFERVKRYGTVFKSHLFFVPCVVMTSPEDLKFTFDNRDKVLSSGAPWPLRRALGTFSIHALDGKPHTDMHKLLADSLLMPELKRKVPEMEKLMLHTMSSWNGNTVDLPGVLQDMIFKIMTLNFFGIPWEDEISDRIAALLLPSVLGITSIPIYFPGTVYYTARNAKKKLNELLLSIVREVRNAQTGGNTNYAKFENFPYQNLLKYEVNGEKLSDSEVCDVLTGTILSGIHGPTSVICIALKYLTESPSTLQKVQAETSQLRKRKDKLGETAFSVSDLKDLKYTTQVFNEVLRINSIVPGGSRTAASEIQFNGYVIPKGWRVVAPVAQIHMDPQFYPDPRKFDPDRFQTPPNPKIYMPFGRGDRACIGRDMTKLIAVMTLYHITSRFTWDIVSSGGEIVNFPVSRMTQKFELAFKSRATE